MLKRYAVFFSVFRSMIDVVTIGVIWIAVYYIRFHSGLFGYPKARMGLKYHLLLMLPIICLCYLGCHWSGLYKPKRIQSMFKQITDLLKASILGGLLVLAFLYYVRSAPYSRKLLAVFVVLLFCGLSFSHLFTMSTLQFLRKKGYNQRHYVVIGAGRKGQTLIKDIESMGWLGLTCAFFVDNNPDLIGSELFGIPVYGPVEKTLELVKAGEIDEVYLALNRNEVRNVYPILETLQCAGITIRIIPDWGNLISISYAVTMPIGSQILFSAGDSPLSGSKIILQEVFDRVTALVLLVTLSIPMALIAVMVKLTSKGPVFYKQTRVGMDQKEFQILKFRTMKVDAEKENGPQWPTKNDSRGTPLGKFLRRTSLDELPQLLNVIKGEMSLVGPRPERPYFVRQFSENHRRYMLRHKVKAGMTGWAQIHGFRGDTSLRKRLVYDLYYVRNWSFGLDLWILLYTPWHIIKGMNAY